jgi:hypothetical protein
MAAPHVAGLAALIMSAQPELIGDVEGLEQAIKDSALPLYTSEGCGGDLPDDTPNHVYGWGRIDAKEAYDSVTNPPEPTPPQWYFPFLIEN